MRKCDIWNDRNISPTEKLIRLALAEFPDAKQAEIIAKTGLSKRTVSAHWAHIKGTRKGRKFDFQVVSEGASPARAPRAPKVHDVHLKGAGDAPLQKEKERVFPHTPFPKEKEKENSLRELRFGVTEPSAVRKRKPRTGPERDQRGDPRITKLSEAFLTLASGKLGYPVVSANYGHMGRFWRIALKSAIPQDSAAPLPPGADPALAVVLNRLANWFDSEASWIKGRHHRFNLFQRHYEELERGPLRDFDRNAPKIDPRLYATA